MKRLIKSVIIVTICLALCGFGNVFALDDDLIFTTAFECKGNVYFCDPDTGTVVLKNLEYSGIEDTNIRTDIRYVIEYTEIPIFLGGISAVDRGKISGDIVNSEYADAEVRVIIAGNGHGYKVVSMLCGIKRK